MAATTIAEIMQGIETRLKTITGLRTSDVVPGQINPPQAIVGVPEIPNYRLTMGKARFEVQPTVTVLVGSAVDRAGQLALADYANPAGASSIPAAIEGDRTLAGTVDDCIVTSFRPLGTEEINQIGYVGGVFTLTVTARGA